jgi:Fur family peroxide stress response transcriptional regulator
LTKAKNADIIYNDSKIGLVLMSDQYSNDVLITRLKEVGLRVTPQRLAIYHTLLTSDAHPTAQALFEQLEPTLPSLSQATVYNTLQALVTHGLIHEIGEAGDGAVHYDADPTPHVNLICLSCQSVQDLFDIPVDDLAKKVRARSGYQVYGVRIAYYGLCPRCQESSAAKS